MNVEFRDEENKIIIEGAPSEADQAQQALEREVADLVRKSCYYCNCKAIWYSMTAPLETDYLRCKDSCKF